MIMQNTTEVIKAILLAGLPIGIITFVLLYFAMKQGYLEAEESLDAFKTRHKEAKKNKEPIKVNPVHDKWLYFGGGFYGVMALITYAHVELLEVYNFFAAYTSFADLIDKISLKAIINLIIDSFLNIIPAFTWFLYWPKVIVMTNGWYWLVASYAGYFLGELIVRKFTNISMK